MYACWSVADICEWCWCCELMLLPAVMVMVLVAGIGLLFPVLCCVGNAVWLRQHPADLAFTFQAIGLMMATACDMMLGGIDHHAC